MSYYFSKTIRMPFENAVARARETLAAEGFGIITEIDVAETFKAKLHEDFRPYLILGACNPGLARDALQVEDKVGTMLPCNVIVQEAGEGCTEVAAIDPEVAMQPIGNPELEQMARRVAQKLKAAIDRI